jgi:hypothetical protein
VSEERCSRTVFYLALAKRGILEATGSGPQRRYQLKAGVRLRVDLPEAEGPETRWVARSTETT